MQRSEEWFVGLERYVNERIQKVLNDDSDEGKGKILEKLWKEKEKKRIKDIDQFREIR